MKVCHGKSMYLSWVKEWQKIHENLMLITWLQMTYRCKNMFPNKKNNNKTKCQASWQEGAKHLHENKENQNKQQQPRYS